ncbi:MAG TPA: hypothetical protein VHM89_16355 [Acidimicrobiales bacterium]|nr:hypothetical protein [Acidimicrobiales bacterium]
MLLWFAGCSLVMVWHVFRDPAIDYRLVVAGALLPDAVDVFLGGPRHIHTLAAAVLTLTAVMVGTRGRRGTRRRVLALPIGMFLHLVLDAMWARTKVFWWPAFGIDLVGDGLPSLGRPPLVVVAQEVVGAVALVWWWGRFRLYEPERRRRFVGTGRLSRDLAGEGRARP